MMKRILALFLLLTLALSGCVSSKPKEAEPVPSPAASVSEAEPQTEEAEPQNEEPDTKEEEDAPEVGNGEITEADGGGPDL